MFKPNFSTPWVRFAVVGVAVFALAIGSGCSATKRLFKGSDKDPYLPTKLTNITPTAKASRLWSAKAGKGDERSGARQGPAFADGHIYAAAIEGGVRAFDAATGKTVWTYASKAQLSGGPGAGDGVVVVGGLNGEVIALDAATGAKKWSGTVSNEVIATPSIGQGLVLVRSNDGRVTAFDTNSGEQRWFATRKMPALTVRGNDSVTFGPGVAFVGNDDGTMSALNLSDGQLIFDLPIGIAEGRTDLDRLADVDGAPVLDGNVLYATSYKNSTIAMDGPSGRILWTADHGGMGRAAVSPSAVIVADKDGVIWALDKTSGSVLWKNEALKYRKIYSPAVQGDFVAVADYEGYVHWLKLSDGSFAARAKLSKDPITSNPIVENGVLVIQNAGGEISAFSVQ